MTKSIQTSAQKCNFYLFALADIQR